ncbi:hypothetical protein MMC15_000069 [Xylographa vitiligo]|nr:hypothetical protein [Xylographa vitiligo]
MGYARYRRSQSEEWAHEFYRDTDTDPEAWYSTFTTLYFGILALQWDVTVEGLYKKLSELDEDAVNIWDEWIDDYLDRLNHLDNLGGQEKSDDDDDTTTKIPGAFPDD